AGRRERRPRRVGTSPRQVEADAAGAAPVLPRPQRVARERWQATAPAGVDAGGRCQRRRAPNDGERTGRGPGRLPAAAHVPVCLSDCSGGGGGEDRVRGDRERRWSGQAEGGGRRLAGGTTRASGACGAGLGRLGGGRGGDRLCARAL